MPGMVSRAAHIISTRGNLRDAAKPNRACTRRAHGAPRLGCYSEYIEQPIASWHKLGKPIVESTSHG
jgi:hypothetical protein